MQFYSHACELLCTCADSPDIVKGTQFKVDVRLNSFVFDLFMNEPYLVSCVFIFTENGESMPSNSQTYTSFHVTNHFLSCIDLLPLM